MGFQIQPAAYTDLDTLADVLVNAHVIDRFFEQLMPKVSHESRVKWYADSFRRTWELKWMKYYKVVELETNKIVAMSRFHYPRKLTAEERAKPEMNHFGPLPEGSNVEMCKSFFEQLEHCEEKYVDRENVYFIYLLMTLPEYHRKGLGKQLMDICLKDADAARAKAFLIATEAGSGLYRKLGFEEVDICSMDARPHGGSEVIRWICMMRESKGWGIWNGIRHINV